MTRRWGGAVAAAALVSLGLASSSVAQPAPPGGAGQPLAPTTIGLKSRTFTPVPGNELAAAAGARLASSGDPVHFLVQFAKIPDAAARARFHGAGVDLQSSLGGGAYIAKASPRDFARVGQLDGFRWAGPLQANDKVDPALAAGAAAAPGARFQAGNVALTVQFHPDVTAAAALDVVARHRGVVIGRTPIPSVSALFAPDALAGLTKEDAVLYVAPLDAPLDNHNDGAVPAIGAGPLAAAPYNLNGAGVTVMVYDSGLVEVGHPDFAGRVVQTDPDTGPPNPVRTNLHSTHVAGTVLGSGANSNGNDSAGVANGGTANQWAGVAPGANLATYGSRDNNTSTDVLYDDAGGLNGDVTTAIGLGIDLTTMSLGNNTGSNGFPCAQLGDYTNTSILLDNFVRGTVGGQQLIYIESAGNERNQACATATGFSTVSSPAGAKNTIVVGAINSNDNTMTNFSSWGPVDDGRLRPDVVGPGCQTTGDLGLTSTGFDSADLILDAGEVTNSYVLMCGTSMATPAVAGVVALLIEQWRDQGEAGLRPLPHTVKALLAHTATDLGNPGPDYSNGFGAVNAQAAVDLLRNNTTEDIITVDQVDQGQTDTWQFTSDGQGAPRVTLAWSDPAATRNSTTQLINNLNLEVTAPDGVVHRPLILNAGSPANNAAEGVDNTNVIEMVVGHASAGTWTVRVAGTTVPTGPQQYTLIMPAQASTTICTAPVAGTPIPGKNLIIVAAPGLVTTGTAGPDAIYGTAGDDRIHGLGGDDVIFGMGGNDQLVGWDGNDSLCGGTGIDMMTGGAGNDLLSGDEGNDDLTGGPGDDTLLGRTGDDRLSGSDGTDLCVRGGQAGDAAVLCETIV